MPSLSLRFLPLPQRKRFPWVFALSLLVLLVTAQAHADGPDGTKAKAIYTESCAFCHGDDGTGDMPGIPDLSEPNGHLSKPDANLIHSIINGVNYPGLATPMPPSELDKSTAKAVLQYLRTTANGGN